MCWPPPEYRLHYVIIRLKVIVNSVRLYISAHPPGMDRHCGPWRLWQKRKTWNKGSSQCSSTNVFLTVLLDSGQCRVHTNDVGIHGIGELQANSMLVIWDIWVRMKCTWARKTYKDSIENWLSTIPFTKMKSLTNVENLVVFPNHRVTMVLWALSQASQTNKLNRTVGTRGGRGFKRTAKTFPSSLYKSSRRSPGLEISCQIFSRAGRAWTRVTNGFVGGLAASGGGRSVTSSHFVTSAGEAYAFIKISLVWYLRMSPLGPSRSLTADQSMISRVSLIQ